MLKIKAEIIWKGDNEYVAGLSNGHHLISSNKSKKEAMNPPEMILASLGACAGIFLHPELGELDGEYSDVEISLEAEKASPPNLFASIMLNYRIRTNIAEQKLKEAIERSQEKCIVKRSLHPDIDINFNLKILDFAQ